MSAITKPVVVTPPLLVVLVAGLERAALTLMRFTALVRVGRSTLPMRATA
ncbi:hypothetical protein HZZ13_34885 [Bradyrhizobium sp. CNPSo 4010]|uniref:Secreted protein n=1 Tax=Bradyrhizobium agreste TaxID=2751811 RepID=A0ABS0Q0C8_9BRAD|nr:hypothetical protein [Bradyrhizobium agreste]MBH5402945.1 hypothetical protein [Bradyrhizobium agreste]